jgi:hypothetical protein
MRSGGLQIHGMVFDIPNGEFKILDRSTQSFAPLDATLERLRRSTGVGVVNA